MWTALQQFQEVKLLVSLGLLLLSVLLSAVGQTEKSWETRRAENPPGVLVTLSLVEQRPFHTGELIEVDVASYDGLPLGASREGVDWTYSGFLLSPTPGCGRWNGPCKYGPFPGPISGNIGPHIFMGGNPVLASRRIAVGDLLPYLPPGDYQLALRFERRAVTRVVEDTRHGGPADPHVFAVSNSVPLRIVAATDEWIQDTVTRSLFTLRYYEEDQSADARQLVSNAAKQLALLDHPVAWRAALTVSPAHDSLLLRRLPETQDPGAVCRLMQEGVARPSQPVTNYYLQILTHVCMRVEYAPTTQMTGGASPEPQSGEQINQRLKRFAYYQEKLRSAASALAANLASKEPAAHTECLKTLQLYLRMFHSAHAREPLPDWATALPQSTEP